ncbi:MAG: FAD-dependent oxidoreductase [Arenicellales bacterium]|nr:FAD-dependent oxidoreductase [Arenicellales bacterium]
MTTPFPNLFNPIEIRGTKLKHRLNFGAHTANMSVEGLPRARHFGYYLERSIGGAAMIVVEPVPVHRTAVLTRGNFLHEDDSIVPHFRKITDACHQHGTVMIQQLYHVGAHADWDNSYEPNWSPSGLPSLHDTDGSHAMREREIEEVIESFAAAAKRAQQAGFDGCELMAAYNALIEQFWSPTTNTRDDKYGGSFENRMRFSNAVLTRIREVTGPAFIIGVAISVDPAFPEVLSVEQHQEIAAWHDKRELYDYVSVGTGGYFDFTRLMPTVLYEDKLGPPYAEAIKQVVTNAKVQAESHIRTPENADYVIASGQADMVSIVRGQIADPHLANKAQAGASEDIRPCISCNHQCWGRRSRDYWISCLINPSAGREFEWGGEPHAPADSTKSILVVGAGPAGLEAARVAAVRGHNVTIAEASGEFGGQFRLAGLQPRRGQILDFINWYAVQFDKLGVDIRYNTPMEADDIKASDAEIVILATGSQPAGTGYQRYLPGVERLPGIDSGNVWAVEDVMSRSARLGETVLILDDTGTWRGMGTAWYLAEKGYKVHLLTPDTYVGRELTRTTSDIPLREKLSKLDVKFITDSVVTEWHGDGATIFSFMTELENKQAFDSLVLACANTPEDGLTRALDQDRRPVFSIGDCVSPRQAPAAIYEGRRIALKL